MGLLAPPGFEKIQSDEKLHQNFEKAQSKSRSPEKEMTEEQSLDSLAS